MMLVAESWTSSPVSLLFATIGILALTIILIVIGIFTWRATVSRKKITLTIASRSQILSAPKSIRDDLEIKYHGGSIEGDLYVTAIELANAGRSPIGSRDFDGERSLQFSLNTRIIKLLFTEHTPKSAPEPVIAASERIFSIAPELIVRDEVIKFALLTEGRPTKVETEFSPLGEVRIRIGDREQLSSQRNRQARIIEAGLALVLLAILILNIVTLDVALNNSNAALNNSTNDFNSAVDNLGCQSLKQDLPTASLGLLGVQNQTQDLLAHGGLPSKFSLSYDEFLVAAQSDLLNLGQDYSNLYITGNVLSVSSRMVAQIQQASADIDDLIRSANKAEAGDLISKLGPIQTALDSKSALPNSCKS
jgi:hypothetical protein